MVSPNCPAELRPDPEAAVVAIDSDGAALATFLRSGTGSWLPRRQLAAVALVLAAKVLLGRPWPARAGAETAEEPDDYDRWPLGN